MFNFFGPFARDPVEQLLQLYRITHRGGGGEITTVTGVSPLVLLNALHKPIHSLKQYGLCTQSATPTPNAPADIWCNNGKIVVSRNMCDVVSANIVVGKYINPSGVVTDDANNFYYAPYVPVTPGETYTMAMSQSIWYFSVAQYDSAQNFLRRTVWGATNTPVGTEKTFDVGADCAYIRFGSNMRKSTISLADVLAVDWMLTQGDTAETYHPYKDWWVEGADEVLTIEGKNLFIGTIEQGNISSSTGENTNATTRCRTESRLPVKPSTEYTVSCEIEGFTSGSSKGIFLYQYLSDGTWITSGWKNPSGYTFTTDALTESIRVVFAYANSGTPTTPDMISKVQLEYGDTATAYQPYVAPQTVTVPTLFSVDSDVRDEVELVGGDVDRNVWVVVFTGAADEPWQEYDGRFYIHTPDTPYPGLLGSGYVATPCTRFRPVATGFYGLADGDIEYSAGEQDIELYYTGASTVAELRTVLSGWAAEGKPLMVCYPKETATEQGTPHALHTTEGTNVVDVTANVSPVELEVEYTAAAAAAGG